MTNDRDKTKRESYSRVYEGILKTDALFKEYTDEILETIFSGSTVQVGDEASPLRPEAISWTSNITQKYFGKPLDPMTPLFYLEIKENQEKAYNQRMSSEWDTFLGGIKEKNPGLHAWIENDLKNADNQAARKEQINMVYGPWVANERVALSHHVDTKQLSSRVWQQGAINQGKIESIVQEAIATGEPRAETYQKLDEWLNPDYAPAIFGEDGIVRRLPGDPNASSAARRLMRTETAKATGMAEIDASLTLPSIIGTEWALASTHTIYDVCDERASDDLYDLGPGIYPPGKVPTYPPHPNCCCALINVHRDEDEEHLRAVNEVREELGLPPLTEDEMGRIIESESARFVLPQSDESDATSSTRTRSQDRSGRTISVDEINDFADSQTIESREELQTLIDQARDEGGIPRSTYDLIEYNIDYYDPEFLLREHLKESPEFRSWYRESYLGMDLEPYGDVNSSDIFQRVYDPQTRRWEWKATAPRQSISDYYWDHALYGSETLSEDQIRAVFNYTTDSTSINRAIRTSTGSESTWTQIHYMDEVAGSFSTESDVVVWRGMSNSSANSFLDSITPEGYIRDSAFISTTYEPAVAADFAFQNTQFRPRTSATIFEIHLPEGTNYIPAGVEDNLGGGEMILSRGSTFEVGEEKVLPNGLRIIELFLKP